jgi:hypothetical protein
LQDWAPPSNPRAIEKLTDTVRKKKIIVRKNFNKDSESFLSVVRVHNRYMKASRKSLFHRSFIKQQQAFKNNPWEFAKSVCKVKSNKVDPSFTSGLISNTFNTRLALNVVLLILFYPTE